MSTRQKTDRRTFIKTSAAAAGGSHAPNSIRSAPDAVFAGALGGALLGARRYAQLASAGRTIRNRRCVGSPGNDAADAL